MDYCWEQEKQWFHLALKQVMTDMQPTQARIIALVDFCWSDKSVEFLNFMLAAYKYVCEGRNFVRSDAKSS